MAGFFEATSDGGAAIALDEIEVSILRSLLVQLLELIGPGEEEPEQQDAAAPWPPFTEGPSDPPSDPALARLFPNAYGGPGVPEDEEVLRASAEFRRYTEPELRTRKREDGLAAVRALDAAGVARDGGVVLTLKPEESRRWLGALNDLRLALGTRLEVSDEDDGGALYRLPDSDPRKPMVMAYLWLGGLQESLVETLTP
ncbi:DUF2017 domain-containing protein [Streptomyces sp. NPDC005438]|uniref:DUF2017 domain-containing protein n=1 Tax=Streptomyces sp. NPDC005438 TaxID=3156880 RepID=UPI0033B17E3E